MRTSGHAVGIDIGGTTSRAALVDSAGTVLDTRRAATPRDFDSLLFWIAESIGAWVDSGRRPISVGLALPGIVSRKDGVLLRSVNLPWLEGREIRAAVESATGFRATLLTDAEAAAWGEYVAAGRPAEPFAHLRLGTGVACGIVVKGRLVAGDPARRTHLPVLVVDRSPSAPACRCGLRGCLELFASGAALVDQLRVPGPASGLEALRAAWESGDNRARKLVDVASESVVRAIANLAGEHAIATVVLGGGVLDALPMLGRLIIQGSKLSAAITASRLGDNAGIIGAATFPDL